MGRRRFLGFVLGRPPILPITAPCRPRSLEKLRGLDILFLDALRHKPHPTHSSVEQSLEIVAEVKPKRAFFTHICHDLAHEETNAALPAGVQLSYDGMKLEFEI